MQKLFTNLELYDIIVKEERDMVSLSNRARPYMADLKKRAAREFSLGYMTKDELDKYCEFQDGLEKIINKCEQRHAKEEKVNESGENNTEVQQ